MIPALGILVVFLFITNWVTLNQRDRAEKWNRRFCEGIIDEENKVITKQCRQAISEWVREQSRR